MKDRVTKQSEAHAHAYTLLYFTTFNFFKCLESMLRGNGMKFFLVNCVDVVHISQLTNLQVLSTVHCT